MFYKVTSIVSKIANKIATLSNVAGTLVVLGLVAIVNYDIFARGIFNLPFRGVYEVVQFSMVLIVFLQLPDVIKTGRLTRSDGLLGIMKNSFPRVASAMNFFINAVSGIVMALITIAIYPEFLDMWETKDYFGVPGIFQAPWWPVKLTVLCSAALCTILFIIKISDASKPSSTSNDKAIENKSTKK